MAKVAFCLALALVSAGTGLGATGQARADETVVICKETVAHPGAALGCLSIAVIARELTAERPFGPNGEVMKLLRAPVHIMSGNIDAAGRESGELAKVLRGTTGISIRDIEKYGIFGGPNSIFRKPFG